jgi:tetratricopeptide (TPR) repeat protein
VENRIMRHVGWVALAASVMIAMAVAAGRPHAVTAAPSGPRRTESEIRSLDIEFYERRVAEDSFSAADRSRLAGLYVQRARETGSDADYERAAVLARRSLRLREAHNGSTYVVLTSALLARHEFAEALRAARRLYAFDTADAGYTALLGEVELEVGDYTSAGRRFAAVAKDADKPSIAARLARWYEVTGRLEKARAILRQSVARLEGSDVPREQLAWFHNRLGELELRSGQLDRADSAFYRALAIQPADYRALGGLARSSAARGDWPVAVELGARAIAIQPDPTTLGAMSEAYAALGDTAQAHSFADAMAATALSQPGAIHRAWGLFLLDHDRDVPRVLKEARASIAARRDVYGYDLLAWAAYKAGHLDEARRAATAAGAQGTEDATLLYHAGVIAFAAGDSAAARSMLTRALAVNPRFDPKHVAHARRTLESLGMALGPVPRAVGGTGRV